MTKTPAETEAARAAAQEMLAGIAAIKAEIGGLEAEYAAKTKQIKEAYAAKIAPWEQLLEEREGGLQRLMREKKAALFADADIVYLAAGQLLFSIVRRVALPKGRDALIALLEKLGLGFTDAVKVKKSVDADAIDKWPDEKLALAGLKRKPPEDLFDYSLQEAKP